MTNLVKEAIELYMETRATATVDVNKEEALYYHLYRQECRLFSCLGKMTEEEKKEYKCAVNESILYENFVTINKRQRSEALELIDKREFVKLAKTYHLIHWYNVKEKNVKLESNKGTDVIEEIGKLSAKLAPNECELYIFGGYDEDNDITYLEASSKLYTIVDISKCESLAKNSASTAMWKIKYQPNGKDTKGYIRIINDYIEKNK